MEIDTKYVLEVIMDFTNALKNEIDNSKTLTQNGAITYVTSGKKLLD